MILLFFLVCFIILYKKFPQISRSLYKKIRIESDPQWLTISKKILVKLGQIFSGAGSDQGVFVESVTSFKNLNLEPIKKESSIHIRLNTRIRNNIFAYNFRQ